MSELVLKQNQELLKKLQGFLIYQDQAITTNQMNKVMRQGVSSLRAYSLLLKTYLDINESWIENYLPYMVHELKKEGCNPQLSAKKSMKTILILKTFVFRKRN